MGWQEALDEQISWTYLISTYIYGPYSFTTHTILFLNRAKSIFSSKVQSKRILFEQSLPWKLEILSICKIFQISIGLHNWCQNLASLNVNSGSKKFVWLLSPNFGAVKETLHIIEKAIRSSHDLYKDCIADLIKLVMQVPHKSILQSRRVEISFYRFKIMEVAFR